MFEITGKYTTAKVMIDDVEQSCVGQIVQMVNHPAFTNPIAIMPDTHAGKGSVIGFTMEMGDKIIPNIVGVDIGCGMLSFYAGSDLFDKISHAELDKAIRKEVPFGMTLRKEVADFCFDWNYLNHNLRKFALEFNSRFGMSMTPVVMNDRAFEEMCKRVGANYDNVLKSVGTLGGGNHFIEIGKSDIDGHYWITIHTGSRNLGKCIAEYWQKVAVADMTTPDDREEQIAEIKETYPKREWGHRIAEIKAAKKHSGVLKGMEYLCGEHMYGYLVDMMVAQYYASVNRGVIADSIATIVEIDEGLRSIETVHNFVDFHDWIIRKGSIRSYNGEFMIIPFNMRDGLLICDGKSNAEWNSSAPHGAGRLFSRSEAKATINKKVAAEQMKGIYTSCIPVDEAPDAYKDAAVIEACIEPTATIVDRIRPVMNMKCAD